MRQISFILVILLFFSLTLNAQKAPFNKGVNLTNWFQVGSAEQIQFSKYTRKDFEQIKSLGCDAIRLPINLHFMTYNAPDYTIDPLFYTFLDEVINWTEELDMHLIIDNHTFDSATDTDPNIGDILLKVWPQMAEHYKETSTKIYYEVLNEPHGITDALWNKIQQDVIVAIRKIDTKHSIIVGPASWNSYNNLKNMPVYTDDNLIYTFHFYDPFIFTHQGASWTDMTDLGGIPFPYYKDSMPEFPESMKSHWSYGAYNDYSNKGTIDEVHRLIDIAIAFQQQRNVPIYCGEFGVFDEKSPNNDRTFWYGVVREYLESNNIAWTIWDYHGGFGIYNNGGNGMFMHDLNVPVVEALGLTAPEQTPFITQPDTTGFKIYGDYPGDNINSSVSTTGEFSFYSINHPNNGKYCIEWSNAAQYNQFSFNFKPDKDLTKLLENKYALDFFIRGSDPLASIDVRFIDTDKGDDDHPWRNRITINNKIVNWNGQWQHLHIPLSDFTEQGSWENDWFNPIGLFDWANIDLLQFVAEEKAMGDDTIWIDNLYITNKDTAQVNINVGVNNLSLSKTAFAIIKQNSDYNIISIQNKTENEIEYIIFDTSGRIYLKDSCKDTKQIDITKLHKGLFIMHLLNNRQIMIEKIIVR